MIFVYARIFKVIHDREKYLKNHASYGAYGALSTIPAKKKRTQTSEHNFGNIIKFKKNSNNTNNKIELSSNEKNNNGQVDLNQQINIPKNLKTELEINPPIPKSDNDEDFKNQNHNSDKEIDSSLFSNNKHGLQEENKFKTLRLSSEKLEHICDFKENSQESFDKNFNYVDNSINRMNSEISNSDEANHVKYFLN
jgi:hypothetical protein